MLTVKRAIGIRKRLIDYYGLALPDDPRLSGFPDDLDLIDEKDNAKLPDQPPEWQVKMLGDNPLRRAWSSLSEEQQAAHDRNVDDLKLRRYKQRTAIDEGFRRQEEAYLARERKIHEIEAARPDLAGLRPLPGKPDRLVQHPMFLGISDEALDALHASMTVVATTSKHEERTPIDSKVDDNPRTRETANNEKPEDEGMRADSKPADEHDGHSDGAGQTRSEKSEGAGNDSGGADSARAGDRAGKANSNQEGTRLVVTTLTDLLSREFPPREMILDPVIPTQGLVMLFAQRGVGKTHVALEIGYAVASGGPALRWSAPKPRRVLLVDGEMPAPTLQERLAKIVAASDRQPPADDYLRIITPDLQQGPMPDLSTPEGQAALEPFLDGVELLILDNLSCLCRTGIENEAESWLPVQEWALALRRRGKSVLFVHHAGKGGLQRGTSRREDVLDTVIALRRPEDYSPEHGAQFIVILEKARGVYGDEAKPFEARLEARDGAARWTMKDIEESSYEKVASYLNDGFSQKEIAEILGLHKGSVSRHARRAYSEGKAPPKRRKGKQEDEE
jgi:DNA-binding CsgD family transcriptional regulator